MATAMVDVELYNPLAPAGSLKALNPASAAYVAGGTVFMDSRGLSYTKGTCSSVYCHSYNDWTTTAPIPDSDPNWQVKGRCHQNLSRCHLGRRSPQLFRLPRQSHADVLYHQRRRRRGQPLMDG